MGASEAFYFAIMPRTKKTTPIMRKIMAPMTGSKAPRGGYRIAATAPQSAKQVSTKTSSAGRPKTSLLC
jgi:hypothetical protein